MLTIELTGAEAIPHPVEYFVIGGFIISNISFQLFLVVPENMTIPVAVFLHQHHAEQWQKVHYSERAMVVSCPNVALFQSTFRQYCNNLSHPQQHHTSYTE